MRLAELDGKKVCILGFGKEGQAMFRAIETHAPNAHMTIADKNPAPINAFIAANSPTNPTKMNTSITTQSGDAWLRDIHFFDVIVKSPGVPMNPELQKVAAKITSATQVFFDTIADSGATVIGVTGSKGKSTTASLIAAILQKAGKNALLVGNIGKPAIDYVDKATDDAIFVMEMSSFQLMDLTASPHIAVVTSFFQEHLDYHGTMDAYREAKARIAKFQTKNDIVVFNADFPDAARIVEQSAGKKIPVTAAGAPLALDETQLIGRHNLGNIALAWTVAQALDVDKETAIKAIKNFVPLPHRLQSLGVRAGIEWVDDAISTTPESAIAGLDALGNRVATMILGGQDRGSDFTDLAKRVTDSTVKTVILFPDTGKRIREALKKAGFTGSMHDAATMDEAVGIAQKQTATSYKLQATNSPIVLLSTASPSYNMFKNFEEKGDVFRAGVERLKY